MRTAGEIEAAAEGRKPSYSTRDAPTSSVTDICAPAARSTNSDQAAPPAAARASRGTLRSPGCSVARGAGLGIAQPRGGVHADRGGREGRRTERDVALDVPLK